MALKKTPLDDDAPAAPADFFAWGGEAQDRYEGLRQAVLEAPSQPPGRIAGLYAERFARYGLLGLLPADPLGEAWTSVARDHWEIEVVSHPSPDAGWRGRRLAALLAELVARHGAPEEAHHACGAVRPRVDRDAREGSDDRQSAGEAAGSGRAARLYLDGSAHVCR